MQIKDYDIHYLYCPRHKKTNQFVDKDCNLTNDIFEAVGWETKELCKQDIQDMDEPNNWKIVLKIIQETIVE